MIIVNFIFLSIFRFTMSPGSGYSSSPSKCPGLKRVKTEWNLSNIDERNGMYRCPIKVIL